MMWTRINRGFRKGISLAVRVPRYALYRAGLSRRASDVLYISDGSGWSTDWDARFICEGVSASGVRCAAATTPWFQATRAIHFGSLWTFSVHLAWTARTSAPIVLTVFHADRGIDSDMDTAIDNLLASRHRINAVVVTNEEMRNRLETWGFPKEKITLIPLGVDLEHFGPLPRQEKKQLRESLGIPTDSVCVGSFQKDGVGWGEGNEPKRIKGPDLFVDAAMELTKKFPVHCLLTGPARGYVKTRLTEAGIPFTHQLVDHYPDLSDLYGCLDVYIVSSRLEGGPKAILETMACGIPLVTTRVGMADDMVEDGQNAVMVDIDDLAGLVAGVTDVIQKAPLQERVIRGGLETAARYDWPVISKRYAKLYTTLLPNRSD